MIDYLKEMKKINIYWEAIKTKKEQVWSLPHTDIFEDDFTIVKKFTNHEAKEAVFVNPPRAGHHSNIAEVVIKYIIDNTEYAVYSVEHKAATQKTKNYGIEKVVNVVNIVYDCIMLDMGVDKKKIHLYGLCQGGWANVMWAALNPEKVKSIIIAGTPIDFVIDGGKCQNWLSFVNNQYIKNVIKAHDGLWPGSHQLTGFKMLNPIDRYFGTYNNLWKLVMNEDEKGIEKWIRNNSWYEHVLDLPGKMIFEVCERLFRKNKLVKGELKLFKKVVDLSKITCPVVCITGDDDDITLTRQCSEFLNYVSSEHKKHYTIPDCGHIAIFLKKSALEKWGKGIKFIEKSLKSK